MRWAAPIALLLILTPALHAQDLPYTTYPTFDRLLGARDAKFATLTRVSDPGTRENPAYTGFFFYQVQQFDQSNRYLLGLKVYCQSRDVRADDRGDVGYFDLKDNLKWTKIGQTTAWNWQQGNRLMWRPKSDEIVWNDRSDDGKTFITRIHDLKTGKQRTLPRPIYDLSPDGSTALTHDYARMKDFKGTEYVGIEDPYENEFAPEKSGVWKMDMQSGKAEMIISLAKMAQIAYPKGIPDKGKLYFFREGYNPSGTRFVAFIKDHANNRFEAWSMAIDGSEVRYLYRMPSHHTWIDDSHIMDFGGHIPPGGEKEVRGYHVFNDDGSGKSTELLWLSNFDGHDSLLPPPYRDWIVSDTYVLGGFQYLFLFHRPTRQFVPLAKLKSTAEHVPNFTGEWRVDLHPRFSRDGRTICIDSSYEGVGRQMYVIDIGYILDQPPRAN